MPQHDMVLAKATEHGGQQPNTVGNDFQRSVIFFLIGDEIVWSCVSGTSLM